MRKYQKRTLGLLVITLAILTGWQLWIWQQNRVPAVPNLLNQAALEAERIPIKEARFDLLHGVAQEWLRLGETDRARALTDKMGVVLQNLQTGEYGGHNWRVRILATLYLELGDVDSALYVARPLVETSRFSDQFEQKQFFGELIKRTSPERALQWLRDACLPDEPSREVRRALWLAAASVAPEFAEQQARLDSPLSVYDLLQLAQGYALHRSAHADTLLDEATRVWNVRPEPRAAAALARALHDTGRDAQAIGVVQTALQRAPNAEASAWLELARETHKLNRPALVRAALRRALQHPDRRRLCRDLHNAANLLQQTGLEAEAREVASRYGSPDDYVRLLVALGELDEAVRIARGNPSALMDASLIDALLERERVQEAQQLALSSVNRMGVVTSVARYYVRRDNLQAALQMLESLPSYQYDSALFSVIEELAKMGQLAEAERVLETAPSMHAGDWLPSSILPRIAQGYIQRKQHREAWRIARTLDAPDARARVMLELASAIRREQQNTPNN